MKSKFAGLNFGSIEVISREQQKKVIGGDGGYPSFNSSQSGFVGTGTAYDEQLIINWRGGGNIAPYGGGSTSGGNNTTGGSCRTVSSTSTGAICTICGDTVIGCN